MAFQTLAEMSRLETIYVHVPVTARNEATGALVDPTSDTVTIAFCQSLKLPATPTWYAADWVTDATNPTSPIYLARALVGPGAGAVTTLAAAPRWWAYAKVVDNPQIPIVRTSQSFRVL